MAEQERTEHEEREMSGVTRNQNVMYVAPHDADAAARLLGSALERLDRETPELQLLVVVPDPDSAILLAREAASLDAARGLRLVPATSVRRATRRLRERPVHGVIGGPVELLELVRTSVLKLERVRVIVMAWVDEVAGGAAATALEAVMAELPKEAARILIASRITAEVEQLAERYARRARRVGDVVGAAAAVPIRYVTTPPWARLATLHRVLDTLDPDVAAVYTRSDATERELRATVASLGYGDEDAGVRVTRGAPVIEATLLVLLELPTRDELRALLGGATPTIVAVIQPRQLDAVRALAGDASVTPLDVSGATSRARERQIAVRAELREALTAGVPVHELVALEPLLDEFDGLEIAAAALRLLERARQATPRESVRAEPDRVAASGGGAWTRIFVGAGTRDRIGPGDLVGAITGEAGITRDKIGRIDLRESHSIVEVAPADADTVVERLTGSNIRGRRVIARIDREPARRPRAGGGRERPGGREGGARGPRGDRSERGDRDDRGRRPPRGRVEGDMRAARPPRPAASHPEGTDDSRDDAR